MRRHSHIRIIIATDNLAYIALVDKNNVVSYSVEKVLRPLRKLLDIVHKLDPVSPKSWRTHL